METTSDINNFMNQPSVVDKKFYNDVIVKNLNLFKEVEDLVYERLDKELKFEKKSKKKSEELEKTREKYEKETDDLQKKIQEEKIKRLKQEKSDFEKFQEFDYNKVIPKNIKNFQNQNQNEQSEKFSVLDFLKRINNLPDTLLNKLKPKEKDSSEQKNFGEEIMRVSFHPEGVIMLKKLLDPIYKALNANTDALDKMVKALQPSGGGGGGLLGLLLIGLLGVIGGIILYIGKVIKAFNDFKTILFNFVDDLIKLPERIKQFLKLDDLAKWMGSKWAKVVDTVKDIGYYFKSYLDEFVLAPFKEKWTEMMDKIKKFINFDEITNAAKVKQAITAEKTAKDLTMLERLYLTISNFGTRILDFWNKWVMSPLEGGLKNSTRLLESIDNILKPIFEWMAKTMNWLSDTFKPVMKMVTNLTDDLARGLGGLMRFASALPVIGQIIRLAKGLSTALIFIDPLVASIQTLFEVWNDKNLNVFEKSVSVLISAFFGLGDGILSLIDMISGGLAGIMSFISGKGWKTENFVSSAINDMNKGQIFGGMGHSMGKKYADWARDGAKEGVMNTIPNVENTPKYKKLQELQKDGLTVEEEAYLDKNFTEDGQQIEDRYFKPQNKSYYIKTSTGEKYKTAPNDEITVAKEGGVLKDGLNSLEKIMKEMNNHIINLNSSMMNNQSILVNNNNTNVSSGGESKEYLFKSIHDVNLDKRSSWWKHSRDYSATS